MLRIAGRASTSPQAGVVQRARGSDRRTKL